ncbi:hypothetical protein QUF80_16470 [Desulfococcaceae bacterium HSG8]|nr:hypothetical protein [Desulfococcaceae bacterium HSG8]
MIGNIRHYNPELADSLSQSADCFDYDAILKLIQADSVYKIK